MAWVRLDDGFPDHPKVGAAGPVAGWLFVSALCYASRYLTDGFVPASQLRRLAEIDDPEGAAAALVRSGLFEVEADGWRIHDYLDHQTSRERVDEARAQNARRQDRWRERNRNASRNAVTNALRNGAVTRDVPPTRDGAAAGTGSGSRAADGDGAGDEDAPSYREVDSGASRNASRNAVTNASRNAVSNAPVTAHTYTYTSRNEETLSAESGARAPDPPEELSREPVEEPVVARATKGRAAAARRPGRLPEGWEPGEAGMEWAAAAGYSRAEVARETERFRDHHAAKGTVMTDWLAAWRNWMRRSEEFGAASGRRPARSGPSLAVVPEASAAYRAAESALPDDWEPSDEQVASVARRVGLSPAQVRVLTEEFAAHARATGKTFANWDTAWLNRMRLVAQQGVAS